MADASSIKVAVERVAMNAFCEVAQKISDEFGIAVHAVQFEYVETTKLGSHERDNRCIGVRIDMSSAPMSP